MRAAGLVGILNFHCAHNVLTRLDNTFNAFFVRIRRGEKPGFPRYKSCLRYDSITFPEHGNGCTLLPSGKLRVQGAGHIKLKLHRYIQGKIKTVTIKRAAGRWYVCFSVEREPIPLPFTGREVGIDLGLNSFAVLANGTEIRNPRHYRNAEARLRCAQRKVARRKKGSKRRRKAVQLLQRAHVHVGNQRRDFQHKESRKLVNEYGLIAVEGLNVKGLASGLCSKSVYDAGWSSFIQMLVYKAEDAGRRIVRVDARGTSQTCTCGANVPKTLADRWHVCPACGLSAARDHVSAQVILSRARKAGLESGAGLIAGQPSGANVEDVNLMRGLRNLLPSGKG